MSLNKVQLIGNLGKDPDIHNTQNGKFVTFTLATTDKGYTNQQGVQVPDRTEWHNIMVSGKLADVVEQYCHKGDKLYIEGKLRTREYEKDGQKRFMTEIFMQNMEMLSPKASSQPQQPTNQPAQNVAPQAAYQPQQGYQQPQGFQQPAPYGNGQGYQPPYQPNGQAPYYPQPSDPFAPQQYNDAPF